jgi:hypothetical protein
MNDLTWRMEGLASRFDDQAGTEEAESMGRAMETKFNVIHLATDFYEALSDGAE